LALFDKMQEFFAPMRARRDELAKDLGYVESILKQGAEKAAAEAEKETEGTQ
jgi:tryptophanyl-tRNA synthetase